MRSKLQLSADCIIGTVGSGVSRSIRCNAVMKACSNALICHVFLLLWQFDCHRRRRQPDYDRYRQQWNSYAYKHITNTPCLKKTKQICFCQNCIKFPPILIIFGRKMANNLNICEVHSFFTSPNLRHHFTVLNANVPNCYITPNVVICNKLLKT